MTITDSKILKPGKTAAKISFVIGIVYLILGVNAGPGSTDFNEVLVGKVNCQNDWSQLPRELISPNGCPNVLDISITAVNVDPFERREFAALMTVYPQGNTGFQTSSGGILNKSVQLMYDSRENTMHQLKSFQISGAQSVDIPLTSTERSYLYPFDSYEGKWTVIAVDDGTGDPRVISISATSKRVNGFNIDYSLASEKAVKLSREINLDGKATIAFAIERSGTQKLMVMLLSIITITGVISSALVTISIYRRNRPPSLSSLAWLATFLFALMQIRGEYPGNPPLGILIDSIITFPAIALILAMIVVNAIAWLNRMDWDMENHPAEES